MQTQIPTDDPILSLFMKKEEAYASFLYRGDRTRLNHSFAPSSRREQQSPGLLHWICSSPATFFRTKKEEAYASSFLVRVTGLEPARSRVGT